MFAGGKDTGIHWIFWNRHPRLDKVENTILNVPILNPEIWASVSNLPFTEQHAHKLKVVIVEIAYQGAKWFVPLTQYRAGDKIE